MKFDHLWVGTIHFNVLLKYYGAIITQQVCTRKPCKNNDFVQMGTKKLTRYSKCLVTGHVEGLETGRWTLDPGDLNSKILKPMP